MHLHRYISMQRGISARKGRKKNPKINLDIQGGGQGQWLGVRGKTKTQLSIAGRRTMQRRHVPPDLGSRSQCQPNSFSFLNEYNFASHKILRSGQYWADLSPEHLAAQIYPSPILARRVINSFFLMHAFPFPKTEQVMVQAGNLKCTQHRLAFQILCSSERQLSPRKLELPSKPVDLFRQKLMRCQLWSWTRIPALLGGRTETRKMTLSKSLFPS